MAILESVGLIVTRRRDGFLTLHRSVWSDRDLDFVELPRLHYKDPAALDRGIRSWLLDEGMPPEQVESLELPVLSPPPGTN